MKPYIATSLRERISLKAKNRCGYCLRTEELMGMQMTVDHIIPSAVGGTTTEDNLWLACRHCNEFKGVQTKARDPQTGEVVNLFNPCKQIWHEHFGWSENGTEIIGKTPCGRATVSALKMNNPQIVVARRMWISAGWWPPLD